MVGVEVEVEVEVDVEVEVELEGSGWWKLTGGDGGLCWGILKTRSHCFVLGNAEVDHQQSNVSCRSLPTAGGQSGSAIGQEQKKKERKKKSLRVGCFFLSLPCFGRGVGEVVGERESDDTNRCGCCLCRQNTQGRVHVDIARCVCSQRAAVRMYSGYLERPSHTCLYVHRP